ncbi:MAG: tetratricopeptide repeat protein [Xenococcaceae cyanobacterium MO_188.B29]|nr:tetratricopeptide repeat protein [Xenococcaceae cyanobacterium MO_188.B29]
MIEQFKNLFSSPLTNQEDLSTSPLESYLPEKLVLAETAKTLIQAGEQLEKQGELEQALSYYHQAVEREPNSAQAHEKLARAWQKRGDFPQAMLHYRQAIALNNAQENLVAEKKSAEIQGSNRQQDRPQSTTMTGEHQSPQREVALGGFPDLSKLRKKAPSSYGGVTVTESNLVDLSSPLLKQQHSQAKGKSTTQSTFLLNESETANSKREAAEIYLQQALAYSDEQEWAEVIEACQHAVRISPDSAEAYKLWGNALQRMGQTSKAMGMYAKAVEIEPDLAEVYANLGSLHARQNKWTKAREYYQKAIIIKPNFPGAYRNLAKVWKQLGEPEKAAECQNQALSLESQGVNPEAYLISGDLLIGANKPERAIEYYLQAIKLAPDLRIGYQKIAETWEKLGQWQEAATYYRQMLKLEPKPSSQPPQLTSNGTTPALPSQQSLLIPKLPVSRKKTQQLLQASPDVPSKQNTVIENKTDKISKLDLEIAKYEQQAQQLTDSAPLQANLGSLYAQKQEWQKALICYQKAIKLNPNLAVVYRNLTKVWGKLGKETEAAKCYYQALSLEPRSANAEQHYHLGNILLKQNQLEEALVCYRRAISLKPDYAQAHFRLGEILQSRGSRTEAIDCWEQAVRFNKTNPNYYYHLGQLLVQAENFERAIFCYQQTIKLQPDYWQTYHHLGQVLSRLSRWQEAVVAYNQALAINKKNPELYLGLGNTLAKTAELDKAIVAYQIALQIEPGYKEASVQLANILRQKERSDGAVQTYRPDGELQPDLPETEQNLNSALKQKSQIDRQKALGSYLQKIEQDPEDIDSYWKAIEIQPDNVELYLQLTSVLVDRGRIHEAMQCYHKAIAVNPDLVELYSSVGEKLKDQGIGQEIASSTPSKILTELPITLSFYQLKETLWKEGKWDEIIALYRNNLQFKPNETELYIGLANALAKQNRLNKAIALYEMVLQLKPNHTEAEIRLKQITERKNRLYRAFQKVSVATPEYALWLKENLPQPSQLDWMPEILESLGYKPLISIIVPVYDPPESFLRQMIQSVLDQIYPYWELYLADDASPKPHVRQILEEYAARDRRIKVVFRQENGHISAASNSALQLATGEFVTLLDHDDLLTPDALYEIALLLNQHPEADMIYSDEDKCDEGGQLSDPYFKPDWCPDSFLSRMYTCHLGTYRRSIVNQIGGFRLGYEGSQDYDLVLRFTEKTNNIFHIPKVLYHWRIHSASAASGSEAKPYAYDAGARALEEALIRRGEPGKVIKNIQVPGIYTVRYEIQDYKLVSIIIPTRNLGDVLDRCLKSIFEKSTYPNYEVIMIDNGSDEAHTMAIFDYWQHREPHRFSCHRLDIPFNYSRLNNFGGFHAKGDYFLFLNNDTEVITPDWIEAMVEQAQRSTIGAVGAKLLYPDNTIQHAGVLLGIGGIANHSHKNFSREHPGYFSQLISVNNYSAITAACLMCRREVFEQVGRFDETLKVAFNDVDFCLKIGQQGYRNVCLPQVVLYHHESKSRGNEDTLEKQQRFQQEIADMQKRWGDLIANDPCYSPNLTREREDYSLRVTFGIEVLEVLPVKQDTQLLWGYSIDSPQPGRIKAGNLNITGWVLGKQSPTAKVEVICNGQIVQKAEVKHPRPDVARAFPHVPGAEKSGLIVSVNVIELPPDVELLVQTVLTDGSTVRLGKVKLRCRAAKQAD